MKRHPEVRPFLASITAPPQPPSVPAARHVRRYDWQTHTRVTLARYDPAAISGLDRRVRDVCTVLSRHGTLSVAEVSAHTRVPLAMTRLILQDLAEASMLDVHTATGRTSPVTTELLERVLDGLQRIPV